jgi:hypothetical protein
LEKHWSISFGGALSFPQGGHIMNELNLVKAATDEVREPSLSPAGYKVLGLLDKGCAYQVHGAWRFRGRHRCVKELSFLRLLANGWAERVETDRHLQIRITPAGRSVNREIPR